LIPEIISGTIETESILNPIRLVVPRATLYVGEVVEVDLAARRVDIRHGLYGHDQEPRALYYDHLVLALGGVPNTGLIPGLAEHAFDVQRLSAAFALRNHLIDTLEQADIETDPIEKQRLLTFVVVGGGATGVEVAAEMRDLVYDATEHYQHIEPEDLRVVIVHGGERLFPDLPARLARFAERILHQRKVEILYQRRATRVDPKGVDIDDGSRIESRTVVGSVGVSPNPLIRALPVPHDERGRVAAERTLAVPGYPNVWVIGDAARVIDPHTKKPYPQTAQHAVREAKLVARNIAAALRGDPPGEMRYRTIGQMIALGHRSAIAYIRGISISGVVAWWMWRTYYLMQLPRWNRRLRVMFDWTVDLFFPPELVQLKVGQPSGPGHGGAVTAPRPRMAQERADDQRASVSPSSVAADASETSPPSPAG
jgi:NADH dehydrogenase